MFPTTACIAALATLPARPGAAGCARSSTPGCNAARPWRAVVAANGLAMPVFCWHMTALVAFLWLYERAGLSLTDEPTAAWWLTRPLWIVGPGARARRPARWAAQPPNARGSAGVAVARTGG